MGVRFALPGARAIKSVAALSSVHEAQVLTYLALTGCPAGLLINFNVPKLVDGVTRLVNPRVVTKHA